MAKSKIKLTPSDHVTMREVFELAIECLEDAPYENDDGTIEQDYIKEIKDLAKYIFNFNIKI